MNEQQQEEVLTDGMRDKELIGYCEFHCQTERALFSAEQINRMIFLSGSEGLVEKATGWRSAREIMKAMCSRARIRLIAQAIGSNKLPEDGVIVLPKPGTQNVFSLCDHRDKVGKR